MAIQIKRAPDESFNEFKEHLQPNHQVVMKADHAHSTYIPQKIYDASVSALAAGIGLDKIEQTGWRYIYKSPNGAFEMAEIGVNETLDKHQFHHVNMGKHVNSFYAHYQQIDKKHRQVRRRDYEMNILRVAAIHLLSIWVKGIDHDHEFFIPLAPVNSKFEADRVYEYKEFMPLLQAAAREVVGHK